jgi:asparagine synthase (glutamine-hydrolysing)
MRGRLPEEILSRKKMGFPVPVGSWLRGPFRHVIDEYVLSSRASQRAIFDPQFVRDIVARHMAGENHSERLWMLINFEVWQRRFIDGEDCTAYDAPGLLNGLTASATFASSQAQRITQ